MAKSQSNNSFQFSNPTEIPSLSPNYQQSLNSLEERLVSVSEADLTVTIVLDENVSGSYLARELRERNNIILPGISTPDSEILRLGIISNGSIATTDKRFIKDLMKGYGRYIDCSEGLSKKEILETIKNAKIKIPVIDKYSSQSYSFSHPVLVLSEEFYPGYGKRLNRYYHAIIPRLGLDENLVKDLAFRFNAYIVTSKPYYPDFQRKIKCKGCDFDCIIESLEERGLPHVF